VTDPRGNGRLPNPAAIPAEDPDPGVEAEEHLGDSRARAAAPAPSERMIDLTLEQSFPASDPPGWTLGIESGRHLPGEEES
jgi:hypothetical protein